MNIKVAEDEETEKRLPDIQKLLYLLEPDDEEWVESVDEALLTDKSMLQDFMDLGDTEDDLRRILQEAYPGIEININLYLWQLVDSIKEQQNIQ